MSDADVELRRQVRDALSHLYDPAYVPAPELLAQLGLAPGVPGAARAALRRAVERLAPDPSVPETARLRRLHDVLRLRYIDGLTQDETAERLGITPRHLRREQGQAIQMLIGRLRGEMDAGAVTAQVDDEGRRSQVRSEVASLQRTAAGRVAEVDRVLRGVVAIVGPLAATHDVDLRVGPVPPTLSTLAPPTALRQILLAVTTDLVRDPQYDRVGLTACSEEGITTLCVRATFRVGAERAEGHGALPSEGPASKDLLDELLAVHGGTRKARAEPGGLCVEVYLPAASRFKVLVVDDNPDLVHFYRRYLADTPYDIAAMSEGERLLEIIERDTPDVIVLDVMLPGIDGWELLTQVHAHPIGRELPVIVCTVVRERELALSLGAAVFVEKPIRRREFLAAIEQALSRAPAVGQ